MIPQSLMRRISRLYRAILISTLRLRTIHSAINMTSDSGRVRGVLHGMICMIRMRRRTLFTGSREISRHACETQAKEEDGVTGESESAVPIGSMPYELGIRKGHRQESRAKL